MKRAAQDAPGSGPQLPKTRGRDPQEGSTVTPSCGPPAPLALRNPLLTLSRMLGLAQVPAQVPPRP